MELVRLLLLSVAVAHSNVNARDFSYNGITGPLAWSNEFSSCKGKHQSPIDIDMLHVKKVKLPPLILHNFDKPPNATVIENNGHTVYFTIETHEETPRIAGGPFANPYVFNQLHFHWGDNDSYGSEDAFNGKHFPMELHVVFYNTAYKDMKAATSHRDGLAVMAFFFKIANPNPAYEEISELLETITKPHTTASFARPLALKDLMLGNLTEYYVYNGSLTTPPCLEIVTWLDFHEPIEISHEQLSRFRSLEDAEGNTLSHNFRPVQPIGDRVVWFTSDEFVTDEENEIHDAIHGQTKRSKSTARVIQSELITVIMPATFVSIFSILFTMK